MSTLQQTQHNSNSGQEKKTSMLRQTLLSLTLGLGLSTTAFAGSPNQTQSPRLRADAPNVYIVKKGDTLWEIAGKYLRSPWRWREIWVANQHIKNPHWIYPNDRLLICKGAQRTVVGKDEGDGCTGVLRRAAQPQAAYNQSQSLDGAISTIASSSIASWLTQMRIIDGATLRTAPYVLASKNRNVISAAGDVIYVRTNLYRVGDYYGVYHQTDRYIDPVTKEIMGYEVQEVARGQVEAVQGGITSVRLTESYLEEVREGDIVLPEPNDTLPVMFYPANPSETPNGKIIRIKGSIDTGALNSVVVLNRGTMDKVKIGHVFDVYHRGELIFDPRAKETVRMPSERTAVAMVFKASERLSYAIILQASGAIKEGDEVRAPNVADDYDY